MMQEKTLIYDGTFEGFLSCIFYVFEYKLAQVSIQNQYIVQNSFLQKMKLSLQTNKNLIEFGKA
jgi:hypothetical protein